MWTEPVRAPPHCTLPLPRGRWRIGTLLQHRPWLCCWSMGPWHTAGGQTACILQRQQALHWCPVAAFNWLLPKPARSLLAPAAASEAPSGSTSSGVLLDQ